MDADSAMGDSLDEHFLDAEERSWGHDGSSGSSRVSGGYHDSSSPDAGYCSPVASAVAGRSKNVVVITGRFRGRELNDKLYALRSVVPNITKMDKASIIKDAILYIQHLQEEERRMLAEIAILETALPAIHGQGGAPAVVLPDSCADQVMPPMKKMRRFLSYSSAVTSTSASAMAAASRRIEALEVRVTGTGDKVLLVSVACRHRKDAMAKVCLALDRLRLAIISSNVTSASGILKHTALVQDRSGTFAPNQLKQMQDPKYSPMVA